MSSQIEFLSLNELVREAHSYRGFMSVFDFNEVHRAVTQIEKEEYYKGY